MIRVLVADDHRMFRQGLRLLIEAETDITMVGEAKDGLEVQELAEQLEPDVILMDINMPGADGLEAMRQVLAGHPDVAIISLTMSGESAHVVEAIRSGARGYLLKDADSGEVMQAIRSVAAGRSVLDTAMTEKVFGEVRVLSQVASRANAAGLTERELEVLSHIAAGESNREIGEKLYLSEKTIKNYVTAIFQKLHTGDRTSAAVYALQHGLISKPTVERRHAIVQR